MEENTTKNEEQKGGSGVYECPYCKKKLMYAQFEDHGTVPFNIGVENENTERIYFCPECREELNYEKLVEAGVLNV